MQDLSTDPIKPAFTRVREVLIEPEMDALKQKIDKALKDAGFEGKITVTALWDGQGNQMLGLNGRILTKDYEKFGQIGEAILTDSERENIAMIKATHGEETGIYWRE